jgi:hypothetical protein
MPGPPTRHQFCRCVMGQPALVKIYAENIPKDLAEMRFVSRQIDRPHQNLEPEDFPVPPDGPLQIRHAQAHLRRAAILYSKRIVKAWRAALVLACLLWGATSAWTNRHTMNADGMSYIDMASAALKDGPGSLVNGYWSPLYPALLSTAFFVFRPSPALEFPLVHFVNFLIFVFALLCFAFFLKSWLAVDRDQNQEENPYLIPFAFGVFLWFTIEFIPLSSTTSDLCVAGIVFLAAGICCRLLLTPNSKHFAALGAILGLGYYVKAAMFPLGLLLLATLFLWPPPESRKKVLLSGLVFLIVAAPWVAVMSSRAGHASIGEAGPLNYAWYVNGFPQPARPGEGLDHPPRLLLDKPAILEYATPVNATYPLSYDPSYWYAGARVRWNVRQQVLAIETSVLHYYQLLTEMAGLLAGVAVLSIFRARPEIRVTRNRAFPWLVIWPLGACAMYGIVVFEKRYLWAFFVLFWLALYRVLCHGANPAARAAVLGTVLCALFIPAARSLPDALLGPNQPDYLRVADALQAAGVHRGDRLATVGHGFDAYYARYLGARVVAEIVDPGEFSRLSAEDMAAVRQRLAAIGVKALVVKNATSNASGFSILTLQ